MLKRGFATFQHLSFRVSMADYPLLPTPPQPKATRFEIWFCPSALGGVENWFQQLSLRVHCTTFVVLTKLIFFELFQIASKIVLEIMSRQKLFIIEQRILGLLEIAIFLVMYFIDWWWFWLNWTLSYTHTRLILIYVEIFCHGLGVLPSSRSLINFMDTESKRSKVW